MIERSRHNLAVLIMLLVLPSWHGALRAQQSDQPVITIFRECVGHCPAYTLDLYNNGRIRYIGFDFVLLQDTEYGRISSDTVRELIEEAGVAGFFNVDAPHVDTPHYGMQVGSIVFDAPTNRIIIRHSGKTIQKDSGFTPLLLHIERASHSVRWTGISRDLNKRELDFGAKFPGADSLMNCMAYLDSLYHAGLDYDTWTNKRGEPGSEWHRRLVLYDQPRRDSVDRALKKYYRSLTDAQVDSLWWIENGKWE
jgi:Domain of unknown function (DUF6438)